jgi:endonuclease YncB( thermonuclease family)
MKTINIIALIVALIGLAFSFSHADAPEFEVKRVLNGKSLQLVDGRIVRLASLQVPNITEQTGLKRAGQPMGVQSHQALIDLVQGKKLRLEFGAQKEDRKGRLIALAYLPDGRNLQAEMISAGWGMVYPFPDLVEPLPAWLRLEDAARKAGKGIWQNDYWQPRAALRLPEENPEERFMLVEGIAKKVAKVKGGWFINFDQDWKSDFTAVISKEDAKEHFQGKDLSWLEGKRLRMRGWIYRYNGPAMDIHQPQQIEPL